MGGRFRRFYVSMNTYREWVGVCEPLVVEVFEEVYDLLVLEGVKSLEGLSLGGCGVRELAAVVKRLWVYRDSYLLFVWDCRVPFTNNLAERDLRHCKSRQKISGCFRSWRGLVCYVRIRSFLSTESKRGHQLLPAVKSLFIKTPITC